MIGCLCILISLYKIELARTLNLLGIQFAKIDKNLILANISEVLKGFKLFTWKHHTHKSNIYFDRNLFDFLQIDPVTSPQRGSQSTPDNTLAQNVPK